MSMENKIISKGANADKFVAEYASEVKNFESEMREEISNMYSILDGLFDAWTGEIADLYRGKIHQNLEMLLLSCEKTEKLAAVLDKRAAQMRAVLEKLKRGSEADDN